MTARPNAEALGYSQASLRDEMGGEWVVFTEKSKIVELITNTAVLLSNEAASTISCPPKTPKWPSNW